MQHYISDSIYGLTLAWITSENSTKQLECQHLLTRSSSLEPIFSATVSGVDRISPSPSPTPCPLLSPTNSLLPWSYHFRIRRDFRSKNPLSGFAPKQTKESSAWRATYIVLHKHTHIYIALSAGAAEYTDCFLCRGVRLPNECPGKDTKQSDCEVPVMQKLWGMRSTPSLPSLPGPLRPRLVALEKGPIYGLNRTKPWFLEFTDFAFKLRIYSKLNC